MTDQKLNKMISNKKKLEHSKTCYDILYPEFKSKKVVNKKKEIFETKKNIKLKKEKKKK